MATYNPKLQGVEGVASASPEGFIRANQMQAGVVKSIFDTGSQLYQEYQEGGVRDAGEAAAALQEEFLDKNVRAEVAAKELSNLKNTQTLFAADATPAQDNAALDSYVSTAQRLKAASEQGMSPDEYTERVAALTRKAIRQFPGMADTLRQTIAQASGLPGADRFAAQHYVRETFGRQKSEGVDKSAIEMRDAEVKEVAANSNVPVGEVYKMYGSPEYLELRKSAYEARGYKLAAETARNQADARIGVSTKESLAAVHSMGAAAAAQSAADFLVFQNANKPLFDKLSQAVQSGTIDSADTNLVELEMLAQQGSAIVAKNFRDARASLNDKLALGKMSQADYDSGLKVIKSQEDLAIENFDPKFIRATAKILANHREKSLQEKTQLMSASTEYIKLFGTSPMITAYIGGDDRTREDLRKQAPEMAAAIDKHLPVLTGLNQGNPSRVDAIRFFDLGTTLADSAANPDPTPVTNALPGASPEVQKEQRKARVQAVTQEGIQILNDYRKNPRDLSQGEANTLATALNNGMAYNAAVDKLANGWETLTEIFKKVPEEDQVKIKASLGQQYSKAADKVNKATQTLDAKYSTKLQVGVRSDGSVGIAPPLELFTNSGSPWGSTATGRSAQKLPDLGVLAQYEVLRYKDIKPGKEAEVERYAKAATEWENTQKRRANSMVLSEVVTTGGNRSTIGGKIAQALNARTPIAPFFDGLPAVQQGDALGSSPNPSIQIQGLDIGDRLSPDNIKELINSPQIEPKTRAKLQAILNDMEKGGK